jgi:hypothetical protein
MRSLIFLASVLFPLFVWADNGRDLQNRVNDLRDFQEKIERQCINNPQRADVRFTINNTTLDCDNMIILADRLQTQLQNDIDELKERCSPGQDSEAQRLATASARVVQQTSCRPASTDSQCMGLYGCAAYAIANPLAPLVGNIQRLNGNSKSCTARGAAAAPGCLQNVIKGIFDSLWSLLSLVWDVGKAAVRSAGEWTGLVRRQENTSSERLMAAQQSGPGFIRRFIANPGSVMQGMITAMYEGIKSAAMNSYGCEEWTGAPFVSRCLRPMTNWDCASCQQKLQLMCGVAGFAVGEIGTAFLTGGLVSGARFIGTAALNGVRAGARAARYSPLARNVIRSIPRPPAAAVRAANAVADATRVVMTASQRRAIQSFEALTTSRQARVLRVSKRRISRHIVTRTTGFVLRPIGMYIHAMDNAFMAGMRAGDNAITVAASRFNRADDVAQGLPELNAAIPPEGRATIVLNETEVAAMSRTDEVAEAVEETARVAPPVETPTPGAVGPRSAAPEVVSAEEQARRLSIDAQVDDLIEGAADAPALIVRYSDDPEYRTLFQGEKAYPEQSRDIAIVIRDMETRSPHLTKPQIRDEVRVFLTTCGPR